jgi:GT2 family glycosyltransferase
MLKKAFDFVHLHVKLSIVIVNYNVKYFLKQCLDSVDNAIKNIDAEVFVVDNNSTDGSVEMVTNDYPKVNFIHNKINVGFSKANNQAIKVSKGEYVLLLNPDTVVKEDTFEKVIDFMDVTPDSGGLGVKMVDGKGEFLPESKRGLPTPDVAFYKIFGLASLFPKSEKFGRYHLGHLDNNKIAPIDVLSGAFMFLRKKTLDEVGLLDETFFMYGEDIDLSYRITLGGYKNYYFPESSIIHYKGESTKKSTVNYVFVFYKAMSIFAEKHFGKSKIKFLNFLIKIAIFGRAGLAVFNRLIEIAFLPLIDASTLFFGLHIAKRIYQNQNEIFHEPSIINIGFGVFTSIMLLALYLFGAYDKPVKLNKLILALFIGTSIIGIVLAFNKNIFPFQTLVTLTGVFISAGSILLIRVGLHLLKINRFSTDLYKKKTLIIGEENEIEKVKILVEQTHPFSKLDSVIKQKNENEILFLTRIKTFLNTTKIHEIIFCSKNLSYGKIIDFMMEKSNSNTEFKIAHPYSHYIIGSTNLNTSGELYTLQLKGINSNHNKRIKRFNDIIASFLILLFSPILIFFITNKSMFYTNIFKILVGNKSFVGYAPHQKNDSLPPIKQGVLNLTDSIEDQKRGQKINIFKLNLIYARDYSMFMDLKTLSRGFKKLDRNSI